MALTPEQRAGSDEAFLREVDDAVRASDLKNFWTRYGRWLVLAIIVGLGAFGGWIIWDRQTTSAADEKGEAFVLALDKLQAGNEKGARADLAKLAKSDHPAYRAMASLVDANLIGQKPENRAAAIAAYGKVAADQSAPQIFRDLALIRQVAAQFDTLQPQQVVDKLKPLAKPGNPWFGSAGELTALAYLKMNKPNLAGPIFAQISQQDGVPQALRARAQQMAGSLGVDAVQAGAKKEGAKAAAGSAGKTE